MHLQWNDDGPGRWKARIDGNRDAHISTTASGSFQARRTGGDPGEGVMGMYPTLEIAKLRFEPNGRDRAAAETAKHDDDHGADKHKTQNQLAQESEARQRLAAEDAIRENAARDAEARLQREKDAAAGTLAGGPPGTADAAGAPGNPAGVSTSTAPAPPVTTGPVDLSPPPPAPPPPVAPST